MRHEGTASKIAAGVVPPAAHAATCCLVLTTKRRRQPMRACNDIPSTSVTPQLRFLQHPSFLSSYSLLCHAQASLRPRPSQSPPMPASYGHAQISRLHTHECHPTCGCLLYNCCFLTQVASLHTISFPSLLEAAAPPPKRTSRSTRRGRTGPSQWLHNASHPERMLGYSLPSTLLKAEQRQHRRPSPTEAGLAGACCACWPRSVSGRRRSR